MGVKKLSVLYPIFQVEQKIEEGLKSVAKQADHDLDVVNLLQVPKDELPRPAVDLLSGDGRFKIVEDNYKNIAQMMNRGFSVAGGEVVVYLPPNIELEEKALPAVRQAFQENVKAGFAYADYEEVFPDGRVEKKKLRNYDGDITERANFGYVKAYSKSVVQALGGYDETMNRAEEYDLRLKISDRWDLVRIPQILYRLRISPEKAEERKANVGASKLFFPGEGKYGGFSYLFYDKDEEKEIEEAFYRMLKRRGAFLSHDNA